MKNNNAFLFFSIGMLISCIIFWILIETSFGSDWKLPKINLNNVFKTTNESKESYDNVKKSKQSTNIVEKVTGTKLLKCTKSEKDDDNYESDKALTITYKNNKLETYEDETISNTNPNSIDFVVEFSNALAKLFSELDGIQMEVTKFSDNSYKTYTKIVYNELNMEQLSKLSENDESAKNIAESDIFKKTGVKMDEYKKELEQEGYSCK